MATAKKGPTKKSGSGGSEAKPESQPKKSTATEDASARVDLPGFNDSIRFGTEGSALFAKAAGLAVICLGASAGLGSSEGDGFRRWSHGYLAAFGVALAVTAG